MTIQICAQYDYLVKVIFCYSASCKALAVHRSGQPYSAFCLPALRKTFLGADNENAFQDNGKQSVEMLCGCLRSAYFVAFLVLVLNL